MRRHPEAARPLLQLLQLVLAGLCAHAGAQAAEPATSPELELGLEELLRQELRTVPRAVEVSTASRFAQSAEQAPAVTHVLTDVDIRNLGLRSFTDILRSLPGLYITSNGNFNYVGARGLGRPGDFNARLLLLVDGTRVNENITDAALIGPEFLVDMALIDRVEFTPGPGSALYGNNAFFGVINVQTKRADKLAGWRANLAADSLRGNSWQTSLGQRFERGGEAWLSLSGFERSRIRSDVPVPQALDEQLKPYNWDRGQRLLARADLGGWSLRVGHSERTRGMPVLYSQQPLEFGQSRSLYRNAFALLAYEASLGAHWDFSADISFKRSVSRLREPARVQGEPRVYQGLSQGRWQQASLRLGSTRWQHHHVLAGLELHSDREQYIGYSLLGDPPFQAFFGDTRRLGIFLQDEWQLSAEHRLVLGLRRDSDKRDPQARLNPRLSWVWSLLGDAQLKLLYGSAYRAANLYEFQINSPWDAPTPAPERMRSLELAFEQRLTPQLHYRASVYQTQLRELISLSAETGLYINQQAVRSRGLELGLERRWDQGERLNLSLSLQRSRDSQGLGLDNSPAALFNLAYTQPLLRERFDDALQLSWQLQGMSRRRFSGGELPGHVLQNLHAVWRLDAHSEMSLGVYNLGDVAYQDRTDPDSPPRLQQGRMLRLQLSRSFGS